MKTLNQKKNDSLVKTKTEKVTLTVLKLYHIVHDSSKPEYLKTSEFINEQIWHSFQLTDAKRTKHTK